MLNEKFDNVPNSPFEELIPIGDATDLKDTSRHLSSGQSFNLHLRFITRSQRLKHSIFYVQIMFAFFQVSIVSLGVL